MQGSPFRISLLLSFHLFSDKVRMCCTQLEFMLNMGMSSSGIGKVAMVKASLLRKALSVFYGHSSLKIDGMAVFVIRVTWLPCFTQKRLTRSCMPTHFCLADYCCFHGSCDVLGSNIL